MGPSEMRVSLGKIGAVGGLLTMASGAAVGLVQWSIPVACPFGTCARPVGYWPGAQAALMVLGGLIVLVSALTRVGGWGRVAVGQVSGWGGTAWVAVAWATAPGPLGPYWVDTLAFPSDEVPRVWVLLWAAIAAFGLLLDAAATLKVRATSTAASAHRENSGPREPEA